MVGLESKADAKRWALAHPAFAGWNRKAILTFAVNNWKARRGNLRGRVHPRVRIGWEGWRSITEKRLRRRLERAGVGVAAAITQPSRAEP